MSSGKIQPNRNLAPMLASFFAALYGLVPCIIVVVAAQDSGSNEWVIIVAGTLAILGLVAFGRRFGSGNVFSNGLFLALRSRRDEAVADYQPRKRGKRRAARFGTNAPPTLDEIRKLRETTAETRWVPRSGRQQTD